MRATGAPSAVYKETRDLFVSRCRFFEPLTTPGAHAFPGYCRAFGELRVPCLGELEQFCAANHYGTCPRYREAITWRGSGGGSGEEGSVDE